MAFPGILRRLFEKDGAGPLLRGDILPLERAAYSVMLTVSGTWTAPYDGFYLAEVQGGGGAGGAAFTYALCGAGGGASGALTTEVLYFAKGHSVPVSIGAGGTPTSTEAVGGQGGTSTFGGLSALGGAGGVGAVNNTYAGYVFLLRGGKARGPGGTPGGFGANESINTTGITTMVTSGEGGSSAFGVGGPRKSLSINNPGISGDSGTGYGSGGSGGTAGGSDRSYGGAGAPGCVRITFLGV